MDKLDLTKIKLFVYRRTQSESRLFVEWGKCFQIMSDKSLASGLYKEHVQLNNNKQLNLKMGNGLE